MTIGEASVGAWLTGLASRTATPGGGAVAALTAATAAGLLGMVTAYTTGPRYADRQARMGELNELAATLRARALTLADEDEVAFAAVGTAYGLPKTTDEEKQARLAAIQSALVGAAAPPAAVGEVALRLVAIAEEIADGANPNVVSDVAVAAANARAALDGAIINVEVNRALIADEGEKKRLADVVAALQVARPRADAVVAIILGKIS